MVDFEVLKGTKDILSNEKIKVDLILDIIRKNFEKYGFRPFDTPIIEYLNILTFKYGEGAEITDEIFTLSDRGERELGLRYDLTTPLCRFVASQKQFKKPFRRYQFGKVFRDGPIKKGRLREFIQCDGDVIGVAGVEIEAELLELFYSTYKELEINPIIEINNNKILRGVFIQNGFKESEISSLILSVDKLKKIGFEKVLEEINLKGFDKDRAKLSIEILSCKSIEELKLKATNDLFKEGIDEIEKLINLIKNLGINYRLNFSMARGLDIYTGNIWEVYDFNNSIVSSIGSGGRFDKVIGEFTNSNEDVLAVGISFGLVPILEVLKYNKKSNSIFKNKETLTDILVVPIGEDFVPYSFKVANKYRIKNNLNVEVFYGYSLKKAFKYCDSLGIKNLILVGENEVNNNEVILKNLKTKEEKLEKI